MLSMPSARRVSLAAVAVLACTSAAVPSAASARSKARASARDTAGSVSAKPTLSPAALAAGHAKYGADATPQQVLSAYWTPKRMRDATPVDDASFVAAAYQRFQATEAARKKTAAG